MWFQIHYLSPTYNTPNSRNLLCSVMSDCKARSVSEISRATMLNNPTTFRLHQTLECHG